MKILHYSLGLPPYRTGGLTKYCTDLMLFQKAQGHKVAVIWPGRIGFLCKKVKIKRAKDFKDIENYEIFNPLPVPLDEGITNIPAFTEKADILIYKEFFKKFKPDVIHFHTLMGLHYEFVLAAKQLNIKTVFTTHDYFGICPRVTFFNKNAVCKNAESCLDCANCNITALSINKIKILQSPLYRTLKNTAFFKKLRADHRSEFFENTALEQPKVLPNKEKDYKTLRDFYVKILESFDFIHFNSTTTKSVYDRFIKPKNSKVISITHNDIADHRRIKDFSHEKVRITYLSPAKKFKGFNLLINTLDDLYKNGVNNFELHIYNNSSLERHYLIKHQNGFSYSQFEQIFSNTDFLVAPSIWLETYGFTVLEALSYGVPVLVSENVGAKDLLSNNKFGLVFSLGNDDFKNKLLFLLNKENLFKINENICNEFDFLTSNSVLELYN